MIIPRTGDRINERAQSIRLTDMSYWAIGAVMMMISVFIYFINTRHGIGVLPDSIRYMQLGYEPYDAPLYPWLLEFVQLSGVSVEGAAVVVGFFFACANTGLIWHIFAKAVGNLLYAVAGTLIIIVSPLFISLNSLALSEPTFLFFLLVSILSIFNYFQSQYRPWLIGSAVALGLATLARFTAPPLGLSIVLALFFDPRQKFARRSTDVVIFILVSALIFGSWVVVSQMVADRSIGRELSFHGNMGLRQWLRSLESLAGWMLPKQIPLSIRSAVFALTGLVGGWLAVKYILGVAKNAHHSNRERLLVMVLGLFSVFYLSFVILATMVEANLSLTPRYAFPAYVTSVMLMIIVLSNYSEANAQLKWIRRALAVLFVVVLSSHVVRTAARSQSAFQSGVGFSSVEWVNSPTIQALQQLPIDAKIYSNAPDVITFLSRRKAILIPQHVKPRTGLDDPVVPYETQLENMRDSMETEHAYLVLFSKVDWRFYLATNEELTKSLPLATLNAKKDGQIYVIADTLKKE